MSFSICVHMLYDINICQEKCFLMIHLSAGDEHQDKVWAGLYKTMDKNVEYVHVMKQCSR